MIEPQTLEPTMTNLKHSRPQLFTQIQVHLLTPLQFLIPQNQSWVLLINNSPQPQTVHNKELVLYSKSKKTQADKEEQIYLSTVHEAKMNLVSKETHSGNIDSNPNELRLANCSKERSKILHKSSYL